MSQGYRSFTSPVELTNTIAAIDLEMLLPGDLAITRDGIHLVVYKGDGIWVQAEPEVGSVISLHGVNGTNRWFTQLVTIHRWRSLND